MHDATGRRHPYQGLPNFQFWNRSFGPDFAHGLDPVSAVRFKITTETKIVAAGSCFAQHVARHIRRRGYNFLITEDVHGLFERKPFDDACAETFNYGLFSARYGNVYTARQLRQLFDRAYGSFEPLTGEWLRKDGRYVDPFRPQVEPDGFMSVEELSNDRAQHLAAVQKAFESADVFVFTLGLTEGWRDRRDGAVYPLAPGVAGGSYDPDVHEFCNFSVGETLEDMRYAINRIRAVNPGVRFLTTVSPVPLNATYEPRHVLQSTVYSKSVLRVAAQMLTDEFDFLDYFPSFEIITSPQCGGRYFAEDMRSVKEEGVQHVMDVFFAHYTDQAEIPVSPVPKPTASTDYNRKMEIAAKVMCDEEAIDNEPAI